MIYTTIVALALIFFTTLTCRDVQNKYLLLSPPILINLFILLYTVIGVYLYWGNEYILMQTNFRSSMPTIYNVICIYTIVFTASFVYFFKSINRKKINHICVPIRLKGNIIAIYSVTLLIYVLLYINGITLGFMHNFILLFFNSLVVILGYGFVTKTKWAKPLIITFTLVIIYLGFRYRLILLLLPILFFIFINKKLSTTLIFKYILLVIIAFTVIAVVGVSRNYSSGLSFEKIYDYNYFDLLVTGIFNDTATVLSSGAVIDYINQFDKFAYFDQIYYVLNYFMPKSIFDDKQYSPIFEYVSIVTNQFSNESGVAVLGFVEYYHTAGYSGVIFFAIISSYFLAYLYKRAVISGNLYYLYFYFSIMAWLINSLTRGYLPQNTADLISILVGLYLIKSKFFNKSKLHNLSPRKYI
jgi:hypothetical protein